MPQMKAVVIAVIIQQYVLSSTRCLTVVRFIFNQFFFQNSKYSKYPWHSRHGVP